MPQVHAYIPGDLAAKLAARARARRVPVSRYLADLIQRDVNAGWPDGYFDLVVGRWEGKPLRRAPQGTLEEREAW